MCAENEKKDCFEYIDSKMPRVRINCVVNGEKICEDVDPTMTLLNFLRTELNLFGSKEGCGEGEIGRAHV